MPDFNLSQTLHFTAETYLYLSYSVIPVWGMADPSRPKVAGVEWGIYQRRRPTLAEIHDWFFTASFAGLAIVTGSISRLVVLDFDTPQGFKAFSAQYPDLAERQVIQTRRGYHIYYQLLPHLHLPSRKGQGIDLLSEGRYVVARPTTIDGHAYKLIRGGMPQTLTAFDVQRLTRFFDGQNSIKVPPPSQHQLIPPVSNGERIQIMDKTPPACNTPADLRHTYHEYVKKCGGRNEALFQVSLKARDERWTAGQVIALLSDTHVRQPAPASHRPETPAQRYQETVKTVQSAFSRPPRQQQLTLPADNQHTIPNTVREALLKLRETRTVRLLDGLRLKGIKPGDTFTIRQALELLKGTVGRDSIYAALKTLSSAGQPLFKQHNPSPAPPTPANAAEKGKTEANKCFIGRAKKSGISPNHRPAALYIMPSDDELCLCLGVKTSRSDPITLDDLATAKKTREALHRELICRRPGIYPRRWLARRLGVSCATIDTYNAEIDGLHSRHCFWEQRIFSWNLKLVPDEIEIGGAVLVDETGKHYPARRTIAARLLGQGRKIIYKRQDANYYWYGELPIGLNTKLGLYTKWGQLEAHQPSSQPFISQPPTTQAAAVGLIHPDHSLDKIQAPALANPVFLRKPLIPVGDLPMPAQNHDVIKAAAAAPQKTTHPLNYHKPLPDTSQEACALRVYNRLNHGLSDPQKRISHATARRLVITYGEPNLQRALSLLANRRNIQRPVGFVMTVLKSEAKFNPIK